MLSVKYFYREPRKTGLSIEGIFHSVRDSLQGRVAIEEFYCDAKLSRFQNIKLAGEHAGAINHITGDVNFLAMGLRGKKTILTVHDLGYYENPVHSKVKKMFYELFWFTLPLKYVDIVTVVSEFTKSKLIQYFRFPEDRIRVIPDPVKPVFHFVEKTQMSEKPVVLMLGTGKHKNLDNLIEAAKDINIHIDIVGWPAPDELARLDQYKISYTVYNGLSDEQVQERYAACDILFMASHYEGFGMPIIEAQTVGRPVITSDIGAMLEVGKDSCLLVDPKSFLEIRNAIMALSNRQLYDRLVKQGLANAAKYDYRKIADQYLEVYEELNRLNS